MRFKAMNDHYAFGRFGLQIPLIGVSYGLGALVLGPLLRRRDAAFRDVAIFGSVFYLLLSHNLN